MRTKTMVKDRFYLIPSIYGVIRDEDPKDIVDLEMHFNDVYKLFLRRLADYEIQPTLDHALENELASLLSELIKIKRKLQEEI